MFHFKTITSQLNLLRYYFIFARLLAYKNKKYLHSTFVENTVSKLFIAVQTFRVSSIFKLYFLFLSPLRKFLRYNLVLGFVGKVYKNKKQEKQQQQQLFFLLGVTKNGIIPIIIFLIFLKFGKLVLDYHP
jgi:hypothetical protein